MDCKQLFTHSCILKICNNWCDRFKITQHVTFDPSLPYLQQLSKTFHRNNTIIHRHRVARVSTKHFINQPPSAPINYTASNSLSARPPPILISSSSRLRRLLRGHIIHSARLISRARLQRGRCPGPREAPGGGRA